MQPIAVQPVTLIQQNCDRKGRAIRAILNPFNQTGITSVTAEEKHVPLRGKRKLTAHHKYGWNL